MDIRNCWKTRDIKITFPDVTTIFQIWQNLIREWCADYTKSEIEDIMDEAGIPCGPVLNVKEAIEHPHIQARDMMVHCEHPTVGDMYFQGCVIKLSETPGEVETDLH